jgi:hypothetical protein
VVGLKEERMRHTARDRNAGQILGLMTFDRQSFGGGLRLVRLAGRLLFTASVALLALAGGAGAEPPFSGAPFLPNLIVSSTIPPNGDLNPYGVAIVPSGFPSGGAIKSGDVLVSNFNNSLNKQGTGTTIIKLTPDGTIAPAGTASRQAYEAECRWICGRSASPTGCAFAHIPTGTTAHDRIEC